MELGLNLDDEDFCETGRKPKVNDHITYVPRQCNPNWFLIQNEQENAVSALSDIKVAADSAYMKKNFAGAINLYNNFLHVSSKNKVTNLSRANIIL